MRDVDSRVRSLERAGAPAQKTLMEVLSAGLAAEKYIPNLQNALNPHPLAYPHNLGVAVKPTFGEIVNPPKERPPNK